MVPSSNNKIIENFSIQEKFVGPIEYMKDYY